MSIIDTAFRLGFEISPVILTGGVAANIGAGGVLPIVSITESINFLTGLLSGGDVLNLDNFFAHFQPIPGGTLSENQIGAYPFANQAIAANAIITQPLRVSLHMFCPVKSPLGYPAKLATMSALQAVLAQHNSMGGTYTVATPSFIYTNCILLSLKDVTSGESKQTQYVYQWDFEQPLITLQQAQQVQNQSTSKMTNGLPTDGSLSGINSTTGNPLSGAAPSAIPATQSLSGATPATPLTQGG